jgi:hypothetical protein
MKVRSALLVSCLGLAYAASCGGDIADATIDIGKATKQITAAVTDCAGSDHAKCVADISSASSDLADAATQISKAVTDCGGAGSACATDLTQLTAAITGLTAEISSMLDDCDGSHKIKCVADVAGGVKDVAALGIDIAKAAKDCGSTSLRAVEDA